MPKQVISFLALLALCGGTPCATDLDCSLNGVCAGSQCACDAPWGGPACSTLTFATTPVSGKSIYNSADPRNTWGGAIVGPDGGGEFHTYVPLYEAGSLWHVETCLHGVASTPAGPWDWRTRANFSCGINPQLLAFPNASNASQTLFSLWERGALLLSASLDGPFVPTRGGGYGGINPAPIFHNGSFYVTSQATTLIETAPSYLGPWTFFANITHPWGPGEAPYSVEDPFLFVDKRGRWHIINHAYNLTQNSSCGSSHVSAHWFSEEGKAWHWSPLAPYNSTIAYDDGTTHAFATCERPNLHFDARGDPDYLVCAVDLDASEQCHPTPKTHNATPCCSCCKFWDHAGTTVVKLAV
jgi:hypothetical protein